MKVLLIALLLSITTCAPKPIATATPAIAPPSERDVYTLPLKANDDDLFCIVAPLGATAPGDGQVRCLYVGQIRSWMLQQRQADR